MKVLLSAWLIAAMMLAAAGCGSVPTGGGTGQPADLTPTAQPSPVSPTSTATLESLPTDTTVPATPPRPEATPTDQTAMPTATTPPTVTPPAPVVSAIDAGVQTVLDYFDAINQRNYALAYQYWSGEGTASGQSFDEFAAGFADTVQVSVQIGVPKEQGTGTARSVTIPVALTSIVNESDNAQRGRYYDETFTLQLEASSSDWKIASATAVEVPAGSRPPADVADPTALLGAYFDAINHHEYARAYTYWNNLGQASQQTFAQFEQGFATTGSVAFMMGTSQVQGAAGSLYASVPIVVVSTERDGTMRSFCGTYTVRRPNVPPFDQLGWRIEQAQIVTTANVQLGSAEAEALLNGGCAQ
jgi:hypothetical protein